MQNNFNINSELKDLLLNDDDIKKKILIALLHIIYKNDNSKDHEHFTLSEYEAIKKLLEKDNELYTSLSNTLKDIINDNVINDIVKTYKDMSITESTHLLDTLSRLLYIQNKYKDGEIGQKIDTKIKEWLDLIKKYQNKEVPKNDNDIEQLKKSIVIYKALTFYQIVPNFNYHIYDKNEFNTPFMELWNYDNVEMETIHAYLLNYINNKLNDSDTYTKYIEDINNFINGIESNINIANFNKDEENTIKEICKKYDVKLDDSSNYVVPNEKEKDFFDELVNALMNYEKTNGFNIQNKDDIKKWHTKSDSFINHLETYDGIALYGLFTMDYTLNHLAYNDYQKEAYKLDLEDDIKVVKDKMNLRESREEQQKVPKKLNAKQLKEKYQDITLLSDNETLDYNRKWARIDTSKVNTNIMDLRENITKRLENNTDITIKNIREIEKKAKPSKEDLETLKDLKETLKEQQEQREQIKNDINELEDDIALLDKQISDTTEAQQIKKLSRRRKQLDKQLQDKKQIINNGGITMQMDLFTGKYTYEKQNKRKKETYKLMLNADYDIQNFNSEGRNFLYYVPNIPNIVNDLDDDFINIDIDDYLDFTGRPNGNVSRIRRNLQNTLKEMRKESYDYSFIDERGALQEGSLVLIGDIRGTEYKGKASVKVQLGATFKDNLKQVFIKNQYAKVNKDVFKLGQGRNNKAENMAKEIFIYLSRLCRIEAKKGTINGQWRKDIHLDLLITHLAEINLLNYNPNTYNKSVKEPLLNALNTGVELGLFSYKTNAFKYYDDVIATNNNGRNTNDKIHNFENGDKYGVQFILNSDMVDLETNQKAHTTYKKYQNKTDRNQEATKK